jgi:N-acetylmuramoyl-L-alanine amidase
MLLLASDIDIAARTVWMEGRGEPYVGMKAIAHVLRNRWVSTSGQFRKDDTLATTCLRHVQFSAWTRGDPNFTKAHAVTVADEVFRLCLRAVLEAFDELDPVGGATHYHTKTIMPYWAEGHQPVKAIGNHLFYVGIK